MKNENQHLKLFFCILIIPRQNKIFYLDFCFKKFLVHNKRNNVPLCLPLEIQLRIDFEEYFFLHNRFDAKVLIHHLECCWKQMLFSAVCFKYFSGRTNKLKMDPACFLTVCVEQKFAWLIYHFNIFKVCYLEKIIFYVSDVSCISLYLLFYH